MSWTHLVRNGCPIWILNGDSEVPLGGRRQQELLKLISDIWCVLNKQLLGTDEE